jgi:hypothetical protein
VRSVRRSGSVPAGGPDRSAQPAAGGELDAVGDAEAVVVGTLAEVLEVVLPGALGSDGLGDAGRDVVAAPRP